MAWEVSPVGPHDIWRRMIQGSTFKSSHWLPSGSVTLVWISMDLPYRYLKGEISIFSFWIST